MPGAVTVVGSINQDYVVRVARRPDAGETLLAGELVLTAGGKGANQAVAAARRGAVVALIGCVGDDDVGVRLRAGLVESGVDVRTLDVVPRVPSGSAFITVTPDGENAIVVAAGANAKVDAVQVEKAADLLGPSDVWVTQLETPVAAAHQAAACAAASGGRFMLNLAPYTDVPADLLALADPLVLNESEASRLMSAPLAGADAVLAVRADLLAVARSVVVTLGSRGAVHLCPQGITRVPAPDVTAVDTTGAGDVFVGALAAALAGGQPEIQSVRFAVGEASAAVTRLGARG